MPRGLAPFGFRGFRRLIGGQLASNLGDAFYAVALPWYVLAVHGGVLHLGEVLGAYGVARTAALVVGGHVSDRLRPWTAMMGADVVRTAALVALASVAALGPARLGLLIPISVIEGLGEGIFLPASYAIVPMLLPDEHLQAGNALTSGGTQLAMLAGPALGGALVALAGPAPAFAVDAASFAVSALSLAAIRVAVARPGVPSPAPAPEPDGSPPPPPPTLRHIIRTERIVPLMLAITIVANLGSGGMSEVALPALAHGPFRAGATGYGVLVAALAAGALLGTFLAARAPGSTRPAVVATFAFLAQAGFTAVVPYLGGAIPAAAALAGSGALNGFGNVLTITAFQRWAPRELLGRLMGVILLGSFGIFPVSVLLASVIVHSFGPAIFFPAAAATLAVTLLFALGRPEWRRFGSEQPGSTRVPAPDVCEPVVR